MEHTHIERNTVTVSAITIVALIIANVFAIMALLIPVLLYMAVK